MYGSHASTILALRAKSSFFYAHPSLSRHRTRSSCCRCRCCCCSSHSSISRCESFTGFPLYGVSVSPSFVYGYYLPLPSLIPRARPSRRLRRVSCGSDGRFLEMIGLLAEAKGRFREIDPEEFLYSDSNWDEEVVVEKSCNGDQKNSLSRNGDRRKSSRKESNAGRKRNESSSDYRSETSVGWSADSEVKEGRCGRINGESSSNYWNRVDEVEKEVREVRKYEDNAWSGREEWDSRKKLESRERNSNVRALSSSKVHEWKVRDREEEEEDDLLVDLERGVRAEYVQRDQRVIEQSESRGGSRKVERMAKLHEDDGERVYRRMDSARNAREGYRGEEQRAVGQQVLRDGSRQVMRISEVHKDDIERPFRSTDSTHEVREEYVRGQKGVIGQRGSREKESRRVVRIAEIHKDDQKRDSRSMDSTHK